MSHTKFPYIGIHLDKLSPPCLQLISSNNQENKVLALKCINLMIENIGRNELKINNLDQVMFDEITKLLQSRELEILEIAIPCSLSLLNLIADPPHKSLELWKPNNYDMFLLTYIEQASLIYGDKSCERRILYLKYLERIIETCQKAIIKHLKSLVTLLIEYMKESVPSDVRLGCVRCFKLLLHHGLPRICAHSIDILMSCVHVLADCHSNGDTAVFNETQDLVLQLKECCNGDLNKHLECLKSFNNKGVQDMVTYVFETKFKDK